MAQTITVTKDMEFIAVYDINKYRISLSKTGNSTVTITSTTGSSPVTEVEHGTSYKVTVSAPVGEDVKVFTINGVNKLQELTTNGYVVVNNVTNEQTVVISSEVRKHTVKFYRKDGSTLIDTQTINYGSQVTPPTPPTEVGYTFREWVEK